MHLRTPLLAVLLALAGVACPLVVTRSAIAQTDPTVEMARQRFREGVQYYDQHDYEKARLAFLQAYAIKPHPAVLLNLAQSELRSGRVADAASHFSQYMRESTESSAAERQEAERGFADARAKVAEVRLEVDTEGADVTVDGDAKGRTPLAGPLYLAPGTHTIDARAGDASGHTTLTVAAGQSTISQIRLTPPQTAATKPSAPGGMEGAGENPSEEEAGEARPSEQPATYAEPQPFLPWIVQKPLAWVGASVMLAGTGTGVYFAAAAHSDYGDADSVASEISRAKKTDEDEYERTYDPTSGGITPDEFRQEPACSLSDAAKAILKPERIAAYESACGKYQEHVDAGDENKKKSVYGFIAGGVGAAVVLGHVVYYFVARPTESASSTRAAPRFAVVPLVSPTFQGFAVSGSF